MLKFVFLGFFWVLSTSSQAEMSALKKAEPYQTEADLPEHIPVYRTFAVVPEQPVVGKPLKAKNKKKKSRRGQ